MENSKIEWTHHTFNPWIGCSKVSAGCANCYAENLMDKRLGKVQWGDSGKRERTGEAYWKKPLAWDKAAAKAGIRQRVFCASLADVFEDRDELVDWRRDLFELIDQTPNLDWLLLTKRPENVIHALAKIMNSPLDEISYSVLDYMPNVWIGTSVENQEQADKRIPELLRIPAKVRFLSCEPLLGPVDLLKAGAIWSDMNNVVHPSYQQIMKHIDWVIVGGESGPNARPMHPDWARSLRDQCVAAKVPFLFKQWGEWAPGDVVIPGGNLRRDVESGIVKQLYNGREPDGHFRKGDALVRRVGKHAAGRMLDGRTWDEYPEGDHA